MVRVLRSAICGSDLWPYGTMPAAEHGRRMGHEFLGAVEDLGGALAIAVYGALLADLGFLDGLRTSLLIAGLLLLATTLASLILRPTPQP